MALALYLFGIGVHSLFPFTKLPDVVWYLTLPLAIALLVYLPQPTPVSTAGGGSGWKHKIIFALCASLFGLWRFDISIPSPNNGVMSRIGESVIIGGRVSSISSYGRGKMLIISAPGTNISVPFFGTSDIRIGSMVEVSCELRTLQETNSARRGAFATCGGTTNVRLRAPPGRFDMLAALSVWHEKLTKRIAAMFPKEEGTLLTGILYGDQSLSSEQRDVMQRAGLMHIVAVSGSNVTIVVAVVMSLVLACGLRRRHAFVVTTIGIVLFVLFVGGSSSVVRAAIMGWFVLFARAVGRAPSAARLLFLSAVVLATLHPWVLVFDVGFALSFLATWGLLAWTPIFFERCLWIPERFGLRESFATTAGATVMTLPYLGYVFGRMSLAGLVTNMLALPLVPFIMLWGCVAAVLGPMVPVLSLPAYGLVFLLERVAYLADYVPAFDIHLEHMSMEAMIILYVLLGWIWCRLRGKSSLSPFLRMVFNNACQIRFRQR